MDPESDVQRFWEKHPEDVEMLESGKLRFTATGMDFPPSAKLAVLEAYRKGRAMQRAAAAKYDFDQHKPFLVEHKERSDKHFLFCTLTNATVPRLPHKVEQHVSGKKYKRLRQEAQKRIEERRKRREEAAKFKKKKKDSRREKRESNSEENAGEHSKEEDISDDDAMNDDDEKPKLKEDDMDADQDEQLEDDGDIHLDPDATLRDILSDSSEGEEDEDDSDNDDSDNDDDDDGDKDNRNHLRSNNGTAKKQRASVNSESTEDEGEDDDDDMKGVKPSVKKGSRKAKMQAASLKRRKGKHQLSAIARAAQLSTTSPSNKTKLKTVKKKTASKPSPGSPGDTSSKSAAGEKRKRSSGSLPRKALRVHQKRKVVT